MRESNYWLPRVSWCQFFKNASNAHGIASPITVRGVGGEAKTIALHSKRDLLLSIGSWCFEMWSCVVGKKTVARPATSAVCGMGTAVAEKTVARPAPVGCGMETDTGPEK